MELQELAAQVGDELSMEIVSSRILLDSLSFINEASRKTSAYVDPRYVPFYYYLGKHVYPKTCVQLGFRLGLLASCFFNSCKTIKHFLGFQQADQDNFYSSRIALNNIKRYYKGDIDLYYGNVSDVNFENRFSKFEWDIAFVNEQLDYDTLLSYLEILWPQMSLGGTIVMEYVVSHEPAAEAFSTFCKVRNRKPVILETRYGTGMVRK